MHISNHSLPYTAHRHVLMAVCQWLIETITQSSFSEGMLTQAMGEYAA